MKKLVIYAVLAATMALAFACKSGGDQQTMQHDQSGTHTSTATGEMHQGEQHQHD